jgi:hypothetical protein
VTHPIWIRRTENVVGHGASGRVNCVRAKVRRVPFERRTHFHVGARTGIIRGKRRAIDSHNVPRHVSIVLIEELTHDLLTQRIPDFTSRRARLVRDESPGPNQVG